MNYDDELKWNKYRDLCEVYKNLLRQSWFPTKRRAFSVAVKKAYPSFYITADYCAKMFRWIESDNPRLKSMMPLTRKKLDYLHARYIEIHLDNPELSKIEICERIVNERAPELYMTGDSAYNFYIDMRKKKLLLDQLKVEQHTNNTNK